MLLSKQVALAEGIAAFALLIGLQMVLTWMSVRSPLFRKMIKSEPQLLLYRGEPLDKALKAERVTRDELMAAIRAQGKSDLQAIHAVVLETDGSFSVVTVGLGDGCTALSRVSGNSADAG